MTVAGVVLAAGGGSRFGRPKALVEFGGSTLIRRSAATLSIAGCRPVVAVAGAQAAAVARSARGATGCVVVNPRWEEGLATSLRAGLGALTSETVEAAVVTLVDQPMVTPQLIERLVAAWSPGTAAVAASYDGIMRTPVLFDRTIWCEVSESAHGDAGARGWLRANPDRVVVVACDDVGAADDIDTPADLRRLTAAVRR